MGDAQRSDDPPASAEPSAASRWRACAAALTGVALAALAACWGAAAAVRALVPPQFIVAADVRYVNTETLAPHALLDLQSEQRRLLSEPTTFRRASDLLRQRAPGIEAGFLDDRDQQKQTARQASWIEAPEGTLRITRRSTRADDDRRRMLALAEALYDANAVRTAEAARLARRHADLVGVRASQHARLQQIESEITAARRHGEARPRAAELASAGSRLDEARRAADAPAIAEAERDLARLQALVERARAADVRIDDYIREQQLIEQQLEHGRAELEVAARQASSAVQPLPVDESHVRVEPHRDARLRYTLIACAGIAVAAAAAGTVAWRRLRPPPQSDF